MYENWNMIAYVFYSAFLVQFFIVWKLVCTLSREQISSAWIDDKRYEYYLWYYLWSLL